VACILLDIDGVLHVSGEPIPGAPEAVSELRRAGHALRFVSNNSTRPRSRLVEELHEMGFELDADELQTTPRAAARELEGKRVLALVMPAIVPCETTANPPTLTPVRRRSALMPPPPNTIPLRLPAPGASSPNDSPFTSPRGLEPGVHSVTLMPLIRTTFSSRQFSRRPVSSGEFPMLIPT